MSPLLQIQRLHRDEEATAHILLGDFALHEARFSHGLMEETTNRAADLRGNWLSDWLCSENVQYALQDDAMVAPIWKRSAGDQKHRSTTSCVATTTGTTRSRRSGQPRL